jgi:hypothetical protein
MRILLLPFLFVSILSYGQNLFTSSLTEHAVSFAIEYPDDYHEYEIEEDELYYFTSEEIDLDDFDEGKLVDGFMIFNAASEDMTAKEAFDELILDATEDGDLEVLGEVETNSYNGYKVHSAKTKVHSEDVPCEGMIISATKFGSSIVVHHVH